MKHVSLCLCLVGVCGLFAADSPELSADEKQIALALVKDLSADQFLTREQAQGKLVAMGPRVQPVLKAAAADTIDTETKLRCERILMKLKVAAEDRPEELAKFAREFAQQREYVLAAECYGKASKLFKDAAGKTKDMDQRRTLTMHSEKAAEREKRASKAGASGKVANADGDIIVTGGIKRMKVIRLGGGVTTISEGDEDDDGGDW